MRALQRVKVAYLREQSRREERMATLQNLCASPKCDPVFWEMYGRELSADARQHKRATRFIRRFLRYRPINATGYHALAGILVRATAHSIRPCRSTAGPRAWRIVMSTTLGITSCSAVPQQTDAALAFLRDRQRRSGVASSQPARTLFWALELLGELKQAFAVLEEALTKRPDDGDLLLFAAQTRASYWRDRHGGDPAGEGRASLPACFPAADGGSPRSAALDRAESLAMWRQVLALEPLAVDANREVAMLLAETESRAAALEHLRDLRTLPAQLPAQHALH